LLQDSVHVQVTNRSAAAAAHDDDADNDDDDAQLIDAGSA